jgi:NAD(P)-dependent dehydrogenase (short-subunit alcohol dehydrogenase family)
MSRSRFEGKVAIVTGGSMGIGRSTVLQLVAEGAHVVTCARRKPKLDELAAAVEGLSGSYTGCELDVGDTAAFARLINDTANKHGRLDLLVNNAPSVIGGMVVDQTLKDWRANFGIGVDSVFIGVQAAMRIMIPQRSGSIVNISSVSSLRAGLASGAYGAAKAALNQFSQCAAMEAAPHNVRINVVAPGAVDTPGLNAATLKNEAVKKTITDAIPMQRAATPGEVAQAICFLGSEDASFITGVILPVDGGKTPQLYVPAFDITNLDNRAG